MHCVGCVARMVSKFCFFFFAGSCIYGYWQYSASLITPVKCAVCRETVSFNSFICNAMFSYYVGKILQKIGDFVK